MRKIREIIRLHFENKLSGNAIAQSCNVSRSVVQECIRKAQRQNLSWPLPDDLDDVRLEQLLYPGNSVPGSRTAVDWEYIHREKRRPSVTLELLWQEYYEQAEKPYSYPQFCRLYLAWRKKLNLVMRQEHRAGEKLFVDWAGDTVRVRNQETGEVKDAQIFVAVWGASNYCYAEACWSQELNNWIGAHIRAFEFYGGVPEILVPDNTKSGVIKADRFDPELNVHYHQMARHYGTAIVPARPYKAKDKAKVEKGVQVVQTWILASLRNRDFFTLEELNAAIANLLDSLNNRPFKKLKGSRASWFNNIDRPAMKPLPSSRYEDEEWRKSKVHPDYHIEVHGHYYSVPYHLIGEVLDIRITPTTIECLFKNNRVASHKRDSRQSKHTTLREHMPKAHQKYLDWTPERFISWASKVGPATCELVKLALDSGDHPQQGFRRCFGILSLEKDFGAQRLESACIRALSVRCWSPSSLRSMLKHGLDRTVIQLPLVLPSTNHENLRGPRYYEDMVQKRDSDEEEAL